ncbi:DnaJ C-terminal domain-containing protein [Helicobacter pylori]|uniref:DnaJ C-terminal domain-containing protein n=1 Tax=Helicobacter pylori TaxID=210 RepID=UPI0002BB9C28|nr:DnaJ C-terminal domain-containing protein [Helicobacter pylori]MBH0258489.1 DnaJ domain-containing protein [Helicobacter pylori]MBH0263069.1 DnaJ domain-containing protein [Helicobacter pylori]MBM0605172.1 DnaJ domain-containing protein [Helicobacter pylori]MBM0612862.1 DnaJ domain-containing protein [Helicobacter pylori]NGP55808.1 DnaJ domain-containing protein [Helicobacter pylori]
MSKSLYQTLNVSENASQDEIKKSYRRLARQYHPDLNKTKEAEEKFKEINAAYEILSDEEKRRQYDQFGDNMFGGQNFSDFARSRRTSEDLDDILSSIFGRGGFSQRFSQNSQGFSGFNFSNFSNFAPENLDMTVTLNVSVLDTLLGNKKQVSVNNETFSLKIPIGVEEGEKIRVRNKGKMGRTGRGDLLLQIHIEEDEMYRREKDDIIQIFDLPLKTALFGGKIEIATWHKTLTLTIPPNTKAMQKFRIKDKGIKNRKTSHVGDLYLQARLILPKTETLSNELKALLEKEL